MSPDRLRKFVEIFQSKKKVSLCDFETRGEYQAFRNWKEKGYPGLHNRQEPEKKENTSPPDPPSPPPPPPPPPLEAVFLKNFFHRWEELTFEEKRFLEVGYRAALKCEESSPNAQIWKTFAKAKFPEFTDRKDDSNDNMEDYKEMWLDLMENQKKDIEVLVREEGEDDEEDEDGTEEDGDIQSSAAS